MLKANKKLIKKTAALCILLSLTCSVIFYLPYKVLKKSTIDSLNQQQLVLARQASQGIIDFFGHYENMLTYLASHGDIIELNEEGKALLEELYSINKGQISAVTRINADGRIIHTVPFNASVIGLDVSQQAHNAYIIKHQKQVVSDVFLAVQGYRTVAYAIPVFKDGVYAGCLTVLIPFDVISKKYLQGIQLGQDGYAWMLNKQGIELYCPVPGHIGKTIWETSSRFPTVIAMAEEMLTGKEGVTTYTYDRIKEKHTEKILKHAVYVPIQLPTTTWSVVVASPDQYAFSAIGGFVRWWLSLFVLVMIGLVAYVIFLVRSQLVTSEGMRRLEAEKKLKKSEQFFQQVINDAHIPLMVINRSGIIELINRKCEELYGYCRDDTPTADDWFKKAYPDTSSRQMMEMMWNDNVKRAIATRSVYTLPSLELPITCKDGSVKDVLFDYTLTDDKLIVSLTDRTLQKSMERDRQRFQEREEKARKLEMIGLLAGGVAHDLNNILSGIVSYPDLLIAQLPENSDLTPALHRVKESGIRAVTLVDDLLTAAKGAATSKEVYEVDRLIREYLDSPEHERIVSNHPEVHFENELSAQGEAICCSPVHIKKSLMNLVANGAEAIEGKGSVRISSSVMEIDPHTASDQGQQPGKYVVIRVSDTGPGIQEQHIQRIFEPFYTKKSLGRSGSGLGLMIVQNSIEDHGGKVEIVSSDSGSTFEIYLPVVNIELDQTSITEHRQSWETGTGEHILIVDDEPLLREIASQILTHAGYSVEAVSSGEEAIEYVRNVTVDLILLDMIMDPGINGRETFQRIREIIPDQKAIIVSGYSESNDIKMTVAHGSGGLLKKPYSREALLQAIRNELRR